MYPGPYGPPFAPPPSAAATARVGPSKWWFVVAGAVAVVASVVAFALVAVAIGDFESRIDGFDRVRVPGTMEVRLDEAGGYSIYHEFAGADTVGGDSLGDPVDETVFRLAPDVTVVSPAGQELALARYHSTVTYATGSHRGHGLYTFRAPEPGRYEVRVEGDEFPVSTIALGRGVGEGVVAPIVAAVVVGTLGVIAGVVMAIVIGVRRGRNRRALLAASVPGGPAAWPYPPGWTYPGAPPPWGGGPQYPTAPPAPWSPPATPPPQPWAPPPPPPPDQPRPAPRDPDTPPPSSGG